MSATVGGSGIDRAITQTCRSIAVTGGKGGVGKSNLSVNLALELGKSGKQIGLLDADHALANADLLCGVSPGFHLGHVVGGSKDIADICIPIAETVTLIPGGSGVEELAGFAITEDSRIFEQLRQLDERFDIMLIDTAAGIAENVAGVLASASEVVVVVTPEPTSIVDAYATIKVALRRAPGKRVSIVVNNIIGIGDAEQVFQSINAAVHGFLDHHLNFLGMIPHDALVQEAIRKQVPVVRYAPDCPASRAIRLIAQQIGSKAMPGSSADHLQSFWKKLGAN